MDCKFRVFFIAVLSLAFASAVYAVTAEKLTVAVSLQPYANIVKSIAGDRVDVVTLLPPGADPHTFEPKPATLKEFAKASVYFSDGSGMDKAWMPRFKGVNKDVQVVGISKGIGWMAAEEVEHHHEGEGVHHEEHHGEHHHEGFDPHVWTSPKKVAVLAQNVLDALVELDPAGKDAYTQNFANFKTQLDALDAELRSAVEALPAGKRTFIVFHPSYGYLAFDYGMQQLSIEVEGKEPKPKDLAFLIEEGKEHFVHIVFVQPQFSKRAAETIAKELNAVVVTTDPLAYDFMGNVRSLVKAISEAAGKYERH